jgi:fructose 1,6-bisphosphate aldolase/phosphatase
MRNQGFIHPATLVPEELEYNKGYEARISKLNEKFKDMDEVDSKRSDKAKRAKKD